MEISEQLRHARRKRAIGGIILVCILLGCAWFAYWHFVLRFEESTDDAYVAGNLVRISPERSGSVSAIYADDTQGVSQGQVLVRLDATDADLDLAKARTELADAVRKTCSLMEDRRRLENVVDQRKKELERAQGDLERRRFPRTAMAVSEEELRHAHDAVAVIGASLRVAQDALRATEMLLQGSPLEEQPAVQRAAHALREAWIALQRCEIRSPVDGYVARRSVQVGMRVAPGDALLAVVPLGEVWVDGNFKEVQIERMRIGQPVRIEADVYGSSVEYAGTVAGLSAGTGSVFSLLPPENATGNWIKVVQRLPVKIVLKDKQQVKDFPLRVGLSCLVRVDVKDAGGSILQTPVNEGPVFSTPVLRLDTGPADREIAEIIAANSPETPSASGDVHGDEQPVSGESSR